MRVLRWIVAVAFTVACAVAGAIVLATYDELTSDLPPLDRLLDYDPPTATHVHAADGALIEEFFRERRYRVPIREIPASVRNAFLAAEDADFYRHRGVDFTGITRAFLVNLRSGGVVQGGSTITQQVVKALLLSPERSYERKLKELLLALRLEQHLTKDEILELYLNQIYLGDGNHGVGAAARNYFDKSVDELTAAEAAMLAGLPAAPSRYAPTRDPEAARQRQLYVLRRMLEERFLGAGEYQTALREQLRLKKAERTTNSVRNYYTEAVRLRLEDMFGDEAPYNQGYVVQTSMQPQLQALAQAAVRNGIESIDRELGYRGPLGNLPEAARAARIASDSADPTLARLDPERLYEALVTSVSAGKAEVALGRHRSTIDVSKLRWHSSAGTRALAAGDLVHVRSRAVAESRPRRADRRGDGAGTTEGDRNAEGEGSQADGDEKVTLHLGQSPEIEAALVAIDVEQGGIAALVGGYDFMRSQFNRALQAQRQPGSAFKPFIYAAALDNGYTAASILQDTPVEYMDHGKPWAPRNYTRDFKGPMRLRSALEQSRNVVSVKLVASIGPRTIVDYLDRFHFDAKFGPNLSIALGTSEMTLLDLVSGFTAFAQGGLKVEPTLVRSVADRDGRTFFEDKPRRREVLSPATAAVMTYMLRGVVERGTATRVRALGRPVAGKTGTTNEQRDAWFIGYTPSLVVGVWVGFDDPSRTMGRMGTGGRVAAPIWLEFMEGALKGQPVRDFEMPDWIRCVNIDAATGARAGEWTKSPFLECFKEGTEPVRSEAPPPPPGWDAAGPSDVWPGGAWPAPPPGGGQPPPPPGAVPGGDPHAQPAWPAPNAPAGQPAWPPTGANGLPRPPSDPRWPDAAPRGQDPAVDPRHVPDTGNPGAADPWRMPSGSAPSGTGSVPSPNVVPDAAAPIAPPASGGRLRAVPQDTGRGVEIRLFPTEEEAPPPPPSPPRDARDDGFRFFPNGETGPREPAAPNR